MVGQFFRRWGGPTIILGGLAGWLIIGFMRSDRMSWALVGDVGVVMALVAGLWWTFAPSPHHTTVADVPSAPKKSRRRVVVTPTEVLDEAEF